MSNQSNNIAQEKPRIIFRADGNSRIGLGHVVRSLALAEMLRQDFECVFAIQAPEKGLQEEIKKVCHGLIVLPVCLPEEKRFVYELRAYVSSQEIVVLDGYSFGTEYQQQLKDTGCTLVCNDDIHAYPFVADAVINHGTLDPSPYQVAFYTKLLLGPRYALLRPPFLQQKKNNNKGDGVFLCFGGSDAYNLTLKFLKSIAGAGLVNHLEVVVGSLYAGYSELQEFVKQQPPHLQLQVHQNVSAEEMARIMSTCDVAVVPGSSIALECASMGLNLVCGYYAENQKGILKMLAGHGAALDAGNFLELEADQLTEAISTVRSKHHPGLSGELLFEKQNPADNLRNEFRKLQLSKRLQIRKAGASDVEIYYNWANDPATRANAVNQEAIPFNAHVRWFSGKLASVQSYLYLFSLEEVPVGQVRFDAEDGSWIIDYSVSPEHRALGLGRAVMARAITQLKQDTQLSPLKLKAKVKAANVASGKVFEGLHFSMTGSESVNGNDFFLYELDL